MTEQQKSKIKLNIIREFKKMHYTIVEVLDIFKDLERCICNLAVEQELKKMKFRRDKK